MNILSENQLDLGKSPTEPDPDIYEHQYIHCDVLVIGAGISGIMAAKTAAKNGLKTLLVDEKPILGGNQRFIKDTEDTSINNQSPSKWISDQINEIKKLDNLEIKTRTSVAAYHGYNYLLASENLTDHLPIDERKE
jgi:sarcosine oxidase subunit alpha